MPHFSKTSLDRLSTCHKDLQRLMHEVIKVTDITILCGHRTKEEQEKAYKAGNSKLRYPASKHNKIPSLAVDCAPFPVSWEDIDSFKALAVIVKQKAKELGIEVEHGGDWKMRDYPHWQIKE